MNKELKKCIKSYMEEVEKGFMHGSEDFLYFAKGYLGQDDEEIVQMINEILKTESK